MNSGKRGALIGLSTESDYTGVIFPVGLPALCFPQWKSSSKISGSLSMSSMERGRNTFTLLISFRPVLNTEEVF